MLLQGAYFEGWHPGRKPSRFTREEFLAYIGEATRHQPGLEPLQDARAVFLAMAQRLTAGEIEAVRRVLPTDVRELWSELGSQAPSAKLMERGDAAYEAYEPGSGGTPAWP